MISRVTTERLPLAVLSSNYGPRISVLNDVFRILRNANEVAIYSSQLPVIRTRWMNHFFCEVYRL